MGEYWLLKHNIKLYEDAIKSIDEFNKHAIVGTGIKIICDDGYDKWSPLIPANDICDFVDSARKEYNDKLNQLKQQLHEYEQTHVHSYLKSVSKEELIKEWEIANEQNN